MGTAGASPRLAVHGAAYVLRSAPCLLFIRFLRVNLCFHRCPSVSFSSALPLSRRTPVQRRVPIPSIPRCRRTGRHFASFPCCPTAARSSWHFWGAPALDAPLRLRCAEPWWFPHLGFNPGSGFHPGGMWFRRAAFLTQPKPLHPHSPQISPSKAFSTARAPMALLHPSWSRLESPSRAAAPSQLLQICSPWVLCPHPAAHREHGCSPFLLFPPA